MKFTSRLKLRFVALLGVFALAILAWAVFGPRIVLGEYRIGAGFAIAPAQVAITDGEDSRDAFAAAAISGFQNCVLERVREIDPRLAAANAGDARFEFESWPIEGDRHWLNFGFAGYSTIHWDLARWGFKHGVPERDDIRRLNDVMESAIIDELRDRGWTRVGD